MEKHHPNSIPASLELRTKKSVKLEPQPQGREDPLAWPITKKINTVAIICLCAFVGQAQAQGSTAGIAIQAELYHKTPTQLSYGTSAGAAGIAIGPIFWLALSNYIGGTATMFWALLGALGCTIWSSAMTGERDYVAFVVSRWAGAHFGSVGSTFGASVILEPFYLHQRGKAFACYTTSILFGVNVGVTISGFIAGSAPWPAQYWWFIGSQGVCIILVALFLEDTAYDRENQQKGRSGSPPPTAYLARRLQPLLAGHRIVSSSPILHEPFDALLMGLQPITIICGLFSMITFGWAVATTVLVPSSYKLPPLKAATDSRPQQTPASASSPGLPLSSANSTASSATTASHSGAVVETAVCVETRVQTLACTPPSRLLLARQSGHSSARRCNTIFLGKSSLWGSSYSIPAKSPSRLLSSTTSPNASLRIPRKSSSSCSSTA